MNLADKVLKLEGEVAKANQAGQELRLVSDAFRKLREGLIEAWQNSDPRDDRGREKLWVATTQLSQVERTLRRIVETGELAKKEMEQIKAAGERRKGFLARPFVRPYV